MTSRPRPSNKGLDWYACYSLGHCHIANLMMVAHKTENTFIYQSISKSEENKTKQTTRTKQNQISTKENKTNQNRAKLKGETKHGGLEH